MRVVRKLFHVPLLRYVDDIRGSEGAPSVGQAYEILCVCMDEIIGLPRKISKATPPSSTMVDLGVRIVTRRNEFLLEPEEEKREKWTQLPRGVIAEGSLTPAAAVFGLSTFSDMLTGSHPVCRQLSG